MTISFSFNLEGLDWVFMASMRFTMGLEGKVFSEWFYDG